MGTPFGNPVVGGGGELVVPLIRSPNYVHAVSGWAIFADGSAEFHDIEIPEGSGGATIYFASSAPASPNAGDLWYNTADGLALSQWNGSSWVSYSIGTGAIAANAITSSLIASGAVGNSQLAAGIVYAGIVDATTINAATLTASTFDGTDFELNSDGAFFYSGTPGTGNLFLTITNPGATGIDGYGNAYTPGGVCFIAIANLTNTFTVQNTNSAALAVIDSSGNITGQTVSGNIDVLVGGQSVAAFIADAPAGVINRGWAPGNTGSLPWPSTPIGTSETALFELDVTIPAGRSYLVACYPSDILLTTAPSAATQYVQRIRYTADGSTPTTSSAQVAGHSPSIVAIDSTSKLNYVTPYMEWIPPTPASNTLYRFLVTALIQSGAFQFQNLIEMRITDQGVDDGQFGNSAVILGTGGGGGGGGLQTYTEYFYPANTYSYYSNYGLRNTNGYMYHGAYSGEGPAYQYSYIGWSTGSLGHTLADLLGSGYTINWAYLRLTNLHSWYDNGMTFGLHYSNTLGTTGYSIIINSGGTFISEGATTQFKLGPAQISDLFAAGNYTVLAPDSADETNLSWYGYFAGGGASSSQKPLITVNYTV